MVIRVPSLCASGVGDFSPKQVSRAQSPKGNRDLWNDARWELQTLEAGTAKLCQSGGLPHPSRILNNHTSSLDTRGGWFAQGGGSPGTEFHLNRCKLGTRAEWEGDVLTEGVLLDTLHDPDSLQ